MSIKLNKQDFIDKANKIHNNKYDYSKTEYINMHTKICIICPTHGEFYQLPCNHLKSCGCYKCYKENKTYSKEEFIELSNKIHDNKYDYSKVDFNNKINGKICIICKIHGEFWQTIDNHLKGKGCPYCFGNKKYTLESFIEKARKVHGDKYDYSQTSLTNLDDKGRIKIICPIHGEFYQTIDNHLKGQNCKYCATNRSFKYTTEEFIEKAKLIHNDKYDYSKTVYKSNKEKIIIICPIHGEFQQTPITHLNGHGCPKCNSSKLENKIKILLENNNITFEEQKTFDWLKYKRKLKLDFYIPKYNVAIECQGKQHFEICNFSNNNKERFIKQFENTKLLDELKYKLCEENNVRLLYFADKKYKDNIITDENDILKIINNYDE
ncbi:MAG: hypothetical protein IKT40_00395 [Bacilli bacterium]|nr:hypothetical protein [Bacilli bacterium]